MVLTVQKRTNTSNSQRCHSFFIFSALSYQTHFYIRIRKVCLKVHLEWKGAKDKNMKYRRRDRYCLGLSNVLNYRVAAIWCIY